MSSLEQRRNSPRRIARGGMMPGYFVMFTAWISGMLTVSAFAALIQWAMLKVSVWSVIAIAAAAILLFAVSARKAEKLIETTKDGGAA